MKLLCIIGLLCYFLVVKAEDLQEALLNRNNRAALVLTHKFASFSLSDGTPVCQAVLDTHLFNCFHKCQTDMDCQFRLGPERSKITYQKPILAEPSSYGNNQYVDQIQINSNVRTLLTSGEYINPDCGLFNPPFEADECVTADLTGTAPLPGLLMQDYLFQTAVDYPGMRCLSGRCARFKDSFPGYGEDFCLPHYDTSTRPAGQCAIGGMTCFASNKVGQPIPFTPIQSFFQSTFTNPDDHSNQGHLDIMDRKAGVEFIPAADSNGNPPALTYSRDPRDNIGLCTCTSDNDCGPGMRCFLVLPTTSVISYSDFTGRCYCTSSAACSARGGGSQQCVTNALVLSAAAHTSATPGSCGCVVGTENSCNYNGLCTSMQQAFPNLYTQTYYTVEEYAKGAAKQPTTIGRCECYGQVNAGNTWNETVTGSACETDLYRDTRCSGHGRPICLQGSGPPAFSLANGAQIGVYCGRDAFANRGLSACVCDVGYGPDIAQPGGTPCNTFFNCQQSPEQVNINGYCECIGDSYQALALINRVTDQTGGACVPNCSLLKSYLKGNCFFNPKISKSQLLTSKPYNNDVQCTTPGWRTWYNPSQAGADQYFDTCYQCTHGSPSVPEFNRLELDGPVTNEFCNVPFEEISKKACGKGKWTPAGCVCDAFLCQYDDVTGALVNNYGYQCDLLTREVLDWGGNPIRLYQLQYPIPYCASSCLTLTGNLTDRATPNEWNVNPQLCGGPVRGSCVSDNIGGMKCVCKNGYTGISCSKALCPRARGRICNNSGKCDASTGKCVCDFSFQGIACEHRVTDCGNSQSIQSFPLPDNSVVDY